MESKRLYQFGEYLLDPMDHCLWRNGQLVSVTPKLLEILLLLVERQGAVVGKTELMEKVWPDTFVEKGNLTQSIFLLRKALEETSGEDFIETVPKRGYRLAVPVTEIKPAASGPAAEPTEAKGPPSEVPRPAPGVRGSAESAGRTPKATQSFIALGMVLLLVLLIGMTRVRSGAFPTAKGAEGITAPVLRVAVFPCHLIRASGNSDPAAALTELLAEKLRSAPELEVLVLPPDSPPQALLETAASRGAEVGVESKIEASSDVLRLTVKVVRVSTGSVIWSDTISEKGDNLAHLQQKLTQRIGTSLVMKLTGPQVNPATAAPTDSLDAFGLYSKGRFFWEQRAFPAVTKGITYFKQAIEKDPNFALAYVGLADCYAFDMGRWFESEGLVRKALELDPNLGEAHATLGFIKMFHGWDWAGAEAEFQTALRLRPDYATAHQWYGTLLLALGRHAEAKIQLDEAYLLNPVSPSINADLAHWLYVRGKFQDSVAKAQEVLEMSPGFPFAHEHLYESHLRLEQFDLAFAAYLNLPMQKSRPEALKKIYEAGGIQALWRSEAEYLERNDKKSTNTFRFTYVIAQNHARLGEKERALETLEKAFQEHSFSLLYLKTDPVFHEIRSHPRFTELVRKMGLPVPEPRL